MKSPHAEQKKLLDLQAVDTGLSQLEHRQKNLAEHAAISELSAARDTLARRLADEVGRLEDVQTELRRLESDAATVAARMQRDEQRLQQTSSVKDVAALESELASLKNRTSSLEDQQLEVMEQAESAQGVVEATRAEAAALDDRIGELTASRTRALDEIAAERGTLTGSRTALVDTIDSALLDVYEKQRERNGIGAALFRAGACGGCTIALTGRDLADVRAAEIDEVVRCPECGCIIVRTEESGLW